MSDDAVGPQKATPKTCRQIEAQTKQLKAELATVPVLTVPSPRQKRAELRRAGFLPGEAAGNACVDCGKQCQRGWWKRVSYEYNEWECWCRDCAYTELHKYDDVDMATCRTPACFPAAGLRVSQECDTMKCPERFSEPRSDHVQF